MNANLGKKVKQTLIQSGRLLNTLADAFGPEDDEFGQGPMHLSYSEKLSSLSGDGFGWVFSEHVSF